MGWRETNTAKKRKKRETLGEESVKEKGTGRKGRDGKIEERVGVTDRVKKAGRC